MTLDKMAVRSPDEWRDVLLAGLGRRMGTINRCEDYYNGKHKMAFTTSQFRETFGNLFAAFADNWCDLVVDAAAERLRVEGFRFGDSGADTAAWEIWQRNGLDAESDMAHTDAIKLGCVYALVGPGDDGSAQIQVEAADKAIVAVDPAAGKRRLAGLRHWTDEWDIQHAEVYTPQAVAWYSKDGEYAEWQEEIGAGSNPLGVVPLVPLPNLPTLSNRLGRSDIERVIPLQNAVNKLCGDMIIASEFAAYSQRWATGIELPINPATGQKMAPDYLGGANRVWGSEDKDAKFGNFAVSDLSTYVRAIEMLVQHVAAQTRTPPHYLLGAMGSFPSGESLKATETGLVAKVRRKMLSFGEGWEEAMRLAFLVEGDKTKGEMIEAEVIWANPESRIVGETVDAATKLASIGVPRPALWEFVGASPQQIERWKEEGDPEPPVTVRANMVIPATPQQLEQMQTDKPIDESPPAPGAPVTPPTQNPPPKSGANK